MKEYYLKERGRERGPYMLDDLKYQNINPKTLVKIEKNGQWIPISEENDLSFLLKVNTDYAITDHNEIGNAHEIRTKNPKAFIIIAVLLLLLGMGFAIFVFLLPVN